MNPVFEGIANLDTALFDSRCVECSERLEFEEEDGGFWQAQHCGKYYVLNTYTVLCTIEGENHDDGGS